MLCKIQCSKKCYDYIRTGNMTVLTCWQFNVLELFEKYIPCV